MPVRFMFLDFTVLTIPKVPYRLSIKVPMVVAPCHGLKSCYSFEPKSFEAGKYESLRDVRLH